MKRHLRLQLATELVVAALVAGGVGVAAAAGPGGPGAHSATAPAASVARASAAPQYASGRVLVKFAPGTSAAARGQLERSTHARSLGTVRDLGVTVLRVKSGSESRVIAVLRRSGKVAYAERDAVALPTDTSPNDPYYPYASSSPYGGEWGDAYTQAAKAWDISTGSPQVTVAVIDSGMDSVHPDLAANALTGYNVLDGTSNVSDNYGHGTEVAGVIAAVTNNAAGVAGYCWQCRLLPVKVYDTSAGAYASDIATGITWAADHGARVINISMAGTATSSALGSAVSYAQSKGVLIVAAAGNSGCNCPTYPASYAGVVAVAATNQYDGLYSYSNYGSWVDIAAPGQNTTTVLVDSSGTPNGYNVFGGTSSAAPVVAGIAGLLFSAAPGATPADVSNAMTGHVDPVTGSATVASGRVNAYKAITAITGAPAATVAPPTSTSAPTVSGGSQEGQTLTATTGSWSGSPTSYSYQWQRCDTTGANCANVSGAIGATYLLTTADVGSTMRVAVTATNSGGSSTAASVATAVVQAAPSSSPSPSPSPSPTATTQTLVFSGSLSSRTTSRSFSVTAGAGMTDAKLSFSKCASMSLTLKSASASIAQTSGPSVLVLDASVTGGTYTYVVSGSCKTSFTLSVTAAA